MDVQSIRLTTFENADQKHKDKTSEITMNEYDAISYFANFKPIFTKKNLVLKHLK